MPPLRKLRIGALQELARQLRFAPAETSRRQLERAEQLAAEVDPTVNYPEDWVIFRVTGYRPQMDAPAIVVGEALLGDISVLVERLSAAAGITEKDLDPAQYLDSAALQARWNVSRKTLDRYRLRGLIARRVASESAVSRLMFPLAGVERFEKQWDRDIKNAAGFSRIGSPLEARMIRRARKYHDRFGCTLNQAARRLADRFGRAHETVRQILRKHDAGAAEPIFSEAGPPAPGERAMIERAWWWGIEPGRIARRLKRSSASIQRVIVDCRAVRLQTLALKAEPGGDAQRTLNSAHCTTGLGATGVIDVAEWLATARAAEPPAQAVERARAVGYHALLARASGGIAALVRHGNSATAVDRIETDLRWAARLKAELVRSQFSLIVRSLEGSIGRPMEELRAPMLVDLIASAIRAVADAVDDFHASKGGRLASPANLAINRIGAGFARQAAAKSEARSRAVGRLAADLKMPDWTRGIAPWQSFRGNLWLEPHAIIRGRLALLQPKPRKLIELRYGWGGTAPRTIAEAAAEVKLPVVRAAAMERRVLGGVGPVRRAQP